MKNTLTVVVASILAGALVLPCAAQTAGANSNAATKKSSAGKTQASPPPSAQDIANAKSQGSVWVNLNSRVYHKGGDLYGKTKHGKFMNEEDAKKQGFREAEEPKTSKKKGGKKAAADQSGVDATINTHTSTPPKP